VHYSELGTRLRLIKRLPVMKASKRSVLRA